MSVKLACAVAGGETESEAVTVMVYGPPAAAMPLKAPVFGFSFSQKDPDPGEGTAVSLPPSAR